MLTVGNTAIALLLAGTFLGGIALFTIARQDDSRNGQILGAAAIAAAATVAILLFAGHHWL